MVPARRWQDMRSADFAAIDPERTVAILPVGAIEQHGPHLPVSVDSTINAALVERIEALAPAELPLTILPLLPVGRSEEHLDFPGSLTFSAETLRRMWFEIGASVARAGLRKLLILNSHGGQIQVMQIVARELRIRHEMFVTACSWPQMGLPEGLVSEEEQRHGIHAGEVETAMMLALRPDLVRMEEARDFRPVYQTCADEFPLLMGLGAAGFGWQAQDLNEAGACGDASRASAATGEAILDHVAGRLVRLVDEISRWPLANLKAR